ncbi:MAG TPA: alpha amylase C-terminal domain-containing protein [Candidatus Angelobacter sp.]|jgi:1,4-alpha-glucan branching enzyme
MISQANISPSTPMGANLVSGGGATFRAWAPSAQAVYINGSFGGTSLMGEGDDLLLANNNGYWTGFVATAKEGDLYRFRVKGQRAEAGFKRDPYARELARDAPFPSCSCILCSGTRYPWHDAAFVTPDFTNMIVYQAHVGVFPLTSAGKAATFLDMITKIPYLAALGANVLQLLPVDEVETEPSMGYNGADYFSPDFPYVATDVATLKARLLIINSLLMEKGMTPLLSLEDITPGPAQLKALVDLCHVYGIAVVFDVVYNHAGGFSVNGQPDNETLYYWDLAKDAGNANDSLYFTDQDRGTGGLSFALWKRDVRQFLINNAKYYIEEFHTDGFRYDEISGLLSMNGDEGWNFCRDLTNTLRFIKPRLWQNAEFWPGEFKDYTKPGPDIVKSVNQGGGGFDVVQHDALRDAVRHAVGASSGGAGASINFDAIGAALFPAGYAQAWQAVTCVENHDIVKIDREKRIPLLANGANQRDKYAQGRSRFATGLLLTAPGIPQLFMGQEFLEDKPWNWDPAVSANLLNWDGLNSGRDTAMVNHLRFTQDLIHVRWNQPALREGSVRAFHVHNQDRVIAFHRWIEGRGHDVIVVATLVEDSWFNYPIGFPAQGPWREIFNSDVYQDWVNPQVVGNGGGISASGPPLHGFQTSASIVIPANGVVVFAKG